MNFINILDRVSIANEDLKDIGQLMTDVTIFFDEYKSITTDAVEGLIYDYKYFAAISRIIMKRMDEINNYLAEIVQDLKK